MSNGDEDNNTDNSGNEPDPRIKPVQTRRVIINSRDKPRRNR